MVYLLGIVAVTTASVAAISSGRLSLGAPRASTMGREL
jgi:hypothetical protein